MGQLKVDNFVITTPILDILYRLQIVNPFGKLRDINPPTGSGDNIVVTCPFHDGGQERKPACNIYIGDSDDIEYGYYRCFACGSKGTFPRFVASCLGSSEEYAKQWLIKNFDSIKSAGIAFDEDIKIQSSRITPLQQTKKGLQESELEKFQNWCPYLAERKLTRETCEKFHIKYDSKYRQIIFPYYNEKGILTTLLKRSIDSKTFYIDKNIDKPIYCIDTVIKSKSKSCILTEGLFDCLLANQYGFPTMALLGNPSPDQAALINKVLDVSTIYLMFDNDEHGREFNKLMHKWLAPRFWLVDVQIENPYKDIGDLDYNTFWSFIKKAEDQPII